MNKSRPRIVERRVPERARAMLEQSGVHPVLARLYAARGVSSKVELNYSPDGLLAPSTLTNAGAAAALLADLLARDARLLIVADYDCDGATACATAVLGLAALAQATGSRAVVEFLVPDRFHFGYGLTPEIVAHAQATMGRPDLIITVDNGIASIEGVAAARAAGIDVLVTDHHLPGPTLPQALIVNPNQPGCDFASKSLAGVGVMFYVLLALRAELRRRDAFTSAEPNLGALTDLVALGTVADVVRLDQNNRILVAAGLKRLREGRARPGVQALFAVAGRSAARAATFDLGFTAGPRLNAAGRLADMRVGIECLIAPDAARAQPLAQQLDQLNRERREIEARMRDEAMARLDAIETDDRIGVTLFDPAWHQGVSGIVASRVKERLNRPTIVFAPAGDDELRGSGRSIAALHLRDCLDLVTKRAPNLIRRFGGHAMAAGLTIARGDYEAFAEAFDAAARSMLAPADLAAEITTDGPLEVTYLNLPFARALEDEVWGQGFPQPVFADTVQVRSQRIVAERHTKLAITLGGQALDAIAFNTVESVPPRVRLAYRVGVDEFNGLARAGLYVEAWESA
ncbi:MAG: single-stranded-DNA-specific exonuclease RecJ [Burkholderiales bacterium]